jgi:hypothetical protein
MATVFTAGMLASIRAIMGMAIPRIVTTATDWVQLAHPRVPPSLPALQQALVPLERQASSYLERLFGTYLGRSEQ